MLVKLLQNFSQDELMSFLPSSTVKFALSFYQNDGSSEIDNKQLAILIASMKAPEFIFNDRLRVRLIESLRPEYFCLIFPDIAQSIEEVTQRSYVEAIEWSQNNLASYSQKLGLTAAYEDSIQPRHQLRSISLISPNYKLYDYQIDISKEIRQNFSRGMRRQLIHLPTGAGKTRTAMNIVSEHLRQDSKNLVLWLADREELCSQAFSEFLKAWEHLGNNERTAYGFYSESDQSLSGINSGFIVAGLHKLLGIRKNNSRQLQLLYQYLREKVTLVVFDEAHKAVAPKFREVVEDFIAHESFNANLLGLTATPGRNYSQDGLSEEDKALSEFFDGNKVSMQVAGYLSPIDYLVENKYLSKAYFQRLDYDNSKISAYELADAGGAETMKALARNKERNRKIIETVMREIENGSYVIIFACTVDHAVNLSAALSMLGVPAASIDSSNDTSESRRFKINQYRDGKIRVLVNFNVLTAGFDAPRTNVAIIAKPVNSLVQYLQMAGRAMRGTKSGGNDKCRIYTVMDHIPEFRSVNIAFEYWNDMWRTGE